MVNCRYTSYEGVPGTDVPEEKCTGAATDVSNANGEHNSVESSVQPVSEFRTVLPQFLATTAKNTILFDLGMTLAFPTIVIPPLLEAVEGLSFTQDEASWFGSIVYICQPAGSLVSGLLLEPLGRKKAMLIVNVPLLIAWILVYAATSKALLFTSALMMGIGAGFMEAPILTYVGEISQPKWRGFLASYSGIYVALGYCFVYLLGFFTDWRTASAICIFVPILSLLVISQVPESPVWLVFHGRYKDAEAALCWLRGFVSPPLVQAELQEMIRNNTKVDKLINRDHVVGTVLESINDTEAQVANDHCKSKTSKSTLKKILTTLHLDEFARRKTVLPLIVVIMVFFFYHMSGVTSTRPFMIKIFEEISTPVDPYFMTLVSSFVGIAGNIICMFTVARIGKRTIAMISILLCAISNITLCLYISFAQNIVAWIPVSLYMLLTFSWSFGIGQLPWLLTSEVFPFRSRIIASGIAAGFGYTLGFIATKTYVNFYNLLTLPGLFGLYGVISAIGAISIFYCVPETEGKSLEDIEKVFKHKFRRLSRVRHSIGDN